MADLVCEQCGKGPFADARALGGHRVVHQVVTCEVCEREVNRKGIGPHRKACRAAYAAIEAAELEAEADGLAELERARRRSGLRDLTPPRIGVDALERAAVLVDAHPGCHGFVVCGSTYGPHLTSRQNVGGLVAAAGEPCLVIDLALLPAVDARESRPSWPHARSR